MTDILSEVLNRLSHFRAARDLLSRLDREAPRQLTAFQIKQILGQYVTHDKTGAIVDQAANAILSAVYVGVGFQTSQSRSPHGEGDYKEPGLDGGWQDISTAPKDGSAVLLLSKAFADERGDHPAKCHIGKWNAEGDSWTDDLGGFDGEICTLSVTGVWESGGGWFQPNEVTHWMPLPSPPHPQSERSPADGQPSIEAAVVSASTAGKGGIQTAQSRSPSNESDYQAPKPD